MSALRDWLIGNGLSHLCVPFENQKIDFDVLPLLGDVDLKELGVDALGDRKRLLTAIGRLREGGASNQSAPVAQVKDESSAKASDSVGEKRQLTVMFCDLVDSTVLATTRDPETYQEIIHEYHLAVTRAVAHFEGHVARFLGDGVLVYFGHPYAHEDEAARAVKAGLKVLEEIGNLRLPGELSVRTRIGIATGTVVIVEVGTGTAAVEMSAAGETPNLAARLQTVARPGEVVVAGLTRRLLDASFDLEALGRLELKGFAEPVEAWRVVGERIVESRFDARVTHGLVRLVGRESELSLLLERWGTTLEGEGQVVLLSGEAGIGKSRLCVALRDQISGDPLVLVQMQCSPYFGNSALYPAVMFLERAAGIAPADGVELKAEKLMRLVGEQLSPAKSGLLLRLVGLPDGGKLQPGLTPQQEKQRTLQALIDWLQAISEAAPVLLLVEDAHWIDPLTEELLALAAHRLHTCRVLTVVTCRPEYVPSWGNAGDLTRLILNRLAKRQCATLVQAASGESSLPSEVVNEIVRKADGIPLFAEELTRTVVQSREPGAPDSVRGCSDSIVELKIPSSLQDSLMARLDTLAAAKAVAQTAAAIGREFSRRLLLASSDMDGANLDVALDQLVATGLVSRNGKMDDVVFAFKHALVRDTAYESMLKRQKASQHLRIAAALEQCEPNMASGWPEVLARHFEAGGDLETSLKYWMKAGSRAIDRVHWREAIAHFERAGEVLRVMPESQSRTERRIDLCFEQRAALWPLGEFGRMREVLSEARGLAEGLSDRRRLGSILWCEATLFSVLGDHARAIRSGQEACDIADAIGEFKLRVVAHYILCQVFWYSGNPAPTAERASFVIELSKKMDPAERFGLAASPGLLARVILAAVRADLGEFTFAIETANESLSIALTIEHAYSETWARYCLGYTYVRQGRFEDAIQVLDIGLAICREQEIRWTLPWIAASLGLAYVKVGRIKDGMILLEESVPAFAKMGWVGVHSTFVSMLADGLLQTGRLPQACQQAKRAVSLARAYQEKSFEAWSLKFLADALLKTANDTKRAAQTYQQALDLASELKLRPLIAHCYAGLAALHEEAGHSTESAVALEVATSMYREMNMFFPH